MVPNETGRLAVIGMGGQQTMIKLEATQAAPAEIKNDVTLTERMRLFVRLENEVTEVLYRTGVSPRCGASALDRAVQEVFSHSRNVLEPPALYDVAWNAVATELRRQLDSNQSKSAGEASEGSEGARPKARGCGFICLMDQIRKALDLLSPLELHCLRLSGGRLSPSAVALVLGISETTLTSCLSKVGRKLQSVKCKHSTLAGTEE